MTLSDNVLDEIFSTPEEDVETFGEYVEKSSESSITKNEAAKIRSTAAFLVETQGRFTIEHGRHESNYAWHIEQTNKGRNNSQEKSIRAIVHAVAKVLRKYLPDDVFLDIYLPQPRHGIEVLTVRANDAIDHWAVGEDTLKMISGRLFEVLNAL